MAKFQVGLVGTGVMGQSLALNIARHGYSVLVYNRDASKARTFVETRVTTERLSAAEHLQDFVDGLETPRRIVLMVNAGKAVDDVIGSLLPLLAKGDCIVDGGNSFYRDTKRRADTVHAAGMAYIGLGVSGGEEGALKGPSMMPGGDSDAYAALEPIFTSIAAHVNGEPCCSYVGPDGAGHYVKMVHNGIEYGIMQLICEVYDLLRKRYGLSAPAIGSIFDRWNAGEMNSYLMEVTGHVLRTVDDQTSKPLVDRILDTAEQKGTGKWTSEDALDLGVPIPTINAAVEMRMLSGLRDQRQKTSTVLTGPGGVVTTPGDQELESLRLALRTSVLLAYAQGMALLSAASAEYGFNLKLDKVAALWRGGCIIRATALQSIMDAYVRDPSLHNLILDPEYAAVLNGGEAALRRVVGSAVESGVPVMALGASLSYFDSYRAHSLPANLLQAQRDFFGAHTFKRIDQDGVFHSTWPV
jgi:6-phosphogluconate dehydrogenase